MSISNTSANALLQATSLPRLRGQTVSFYMLALRGGVSIGSTSTRLIVQDDEREEFEELQSSLREEVRPEGALEQDVFTQLLHASWNLRRSRRLEAEQFVNGVDPLTDPAKQAEMDRLARYQARHERSYYRALKELRTLQTNCMIRITLERQGKLRGQAPGLVSWGEVSKRTHLRRRNRAARVEHAGHLTLPRLRRRASLRDNLRR